MALAVHISPPMFSRPIDEPQVKVLRQMPRRVLLHGAIVVIENAWTGHDSHAGEKDGFHEGFRPNEDPSQSIPLFGKRKIQNEETQHQCDVDPLQ
jgi:hypothetical protein